LYASIEPILGLYEIEHIQEGKLNFHPEAIISEKVNNLHKTG
jgi:hypothetical protein